MKKFFASLICLALLAMFVSPAQAIPPFNEMFKKTYVPAGSPVEEAVMAAKCNVCHVGKEKKEKNEYGKAVGKYLKKADFAGDDKKFDPKSEEGQKALAEGLAKAGAEKSTSGKTFDEILKSGKLPVTE